MTTAQWNWIIDQMIHDNPDKKQPNQGKETFMIVNDEKVFQ